MAQQMIGRRRLAILGALAVSMFGLASCGGSDDDGDSAAQRTATERQAADSQPSRDKPAAKARDDDGTAKQRDDAAGDDPAAGTPSPSNDAPQGGDETAAVTAAVTAMYDSMARGDAAGVCAVMSRAVREETAQQVLGGSTSPPESRTCEASLAKFLDAAEGSETLSKVPEAEVTNVAVRGNTARATVSFGSTAGQVQLVREGGAWRFDASPTPK